MPEKRTAPIRRRDRTRLAAGWLTGVLLAAMIAGCATTQDPQPGSIAEPAAANRSQPREDLLRTGIQPWLGTPHRMGGLSRRGVDCSGLTVNLYRDLFGIRLPRTTRAQMRTGRWVDRGQLTPGDLVFFKPVKKYHHVGIYLGDGEFVHTSTRQGVMVSRLDDDFWQSCYLTGRRLLP